MPVASVAHNVNDGVFLKRLAVIGRKLADEGDGLDVVAVHVEHRRVGHLGDVRAVRSRACEAGIGREANLRTEGPPARRSRIPRPVPQTRRRRASGWPWTCRGSSRLWSRTGAPAFCRGRQDRRPRDGTDWPRATSERASLTASAARSSCQGDTSRRRNLRLPVPWIRRTLPESTH
ncbi:MAG: hypothetical protein BJ554DRAFT_7431 [Olpidium bornovanus]|uniref:Uncharacterized protein n=1 Tax=Olpidium bornovanus TaxID=278681 RepID=A0A8H8DM77_9FUNG|nr:MAG: hypothetical protein BJ554DRAFT_7431 [Olpidium bornovanus]